MAGLSCGAKCAKAILFVFNGIFFLSGALLLGLGIWMKVDKNVSQYVELAGGQMMFEAAAILFICVGAFIFVVGFFGCCGAIKESSCMLCVYIVLLTVIFIIEIAAGVLAAVYRNRLADELQEQMAEQAKTQVKPIYGEKDVNQTVPNLTWQRIQHEFQCCGGNGSNDYRSNPNFNANYPVPQTCCVLKNEDPEAPEPADWDVCRQEFDPGFTGEQKNLYKDGCRDGLFNWVSRQAIILIGVGIGIAIIQILGIVFACCVRREIANNPKY